MRAFAKTDIGCVRTMNQDSYFCSHDEIGPFPNLFIIADGMGGHQAGDYASRYAIEAFLEYLQTTTKDTLIAILDEGIAYANRAVYQASLEHKELAGMGTTLVMAYVEDNQLIVANVGDSRLYLIGDEITQVTEDHSYVAAMVRAGEITAEEAKTHPDKNVITRAIGVTKDVRVDFFEVDLQPEDIILMCTDGLTNLVTDDTIFEQVKFYGIEKACELLVDEAKKNGGTDNITAILIEPEVEEVNEC